MGHPKIDYTCWLCEDADGKPVVPATHRLLVREVGQQMGDEVWGCRVHILELYLDFLACGKPLDIIVHDMKTGACVVEAHPRRVG
jgi:hypothetical protein